MSKMKYSFVRAKAKPNIIELKCQTPENRPQTIRLVMDTLEKAQLALASLHPGWTILESRTI